MKTTALRITTQVLPGQKIEIQDPDLPVGETVDVFIVSQKQAEQKRSSVVKMIEEIRSHRKTFTDVEEINKFLAEERESWDS